MARSSRVAGLQAPKRREQAVHLLAGNGRMIYSNSVARNKLGIKWLRAHLVVS